MTFELFIVLAVWIVIMPMANMAANELWWGSEYARMRIMASFGWPVLLVVIWGTILIGFPLYYLRKLLIRVLRPVAKNWSRQTKDRVMWWINKLPS